ncbi:phosphoglycerate mutase family protein [Janthinobacterium sp. SUN120]|uniref:phosphoglycerate mutase family protein n=1 Tax=Janthinobacterium sp. SUN120 TaxID=3004099 RepID=UPI0025B16FAB|nr:phosphoglycerate mutase family protein [Janthinobacterium sp. SUN120]MDN2717746.1 phosphoglycerate mutase family protein [Janthinobacterium sp. SUN120]
MKQKWPQHICIVRHSQSTGNVARDADVPLAKLGARQAQALGDWFATLPPEQQATVVLYSPYMRARRTAQAVLARISADSLPCVVADERLREKSSASSTAGGDRHTSHDPARHAGRAETLSARS